MNESKINMKKISQIEGTNLKTNYLISPNSLYPGKITLSWIPVHAKRQTAYQVVGKQAGIKVFDSGKVESDAFLSDPDYIPEGGCHIDWELVLWDENNCQGPTISAWFETVPVIKDWKAKWIDPETIRPVKTETEEIRNPASYLMKTFQTEKSHQARLYATAHGIYDIWLNRTHLDGWLLAPGTSQYDKRLMVQAYDISDLLKEGDNTLLVSIGDGWYRGSVGNNMDINTFGDDIAFLCQLNADGKTILCTDETWKASNEGPLGPNDFMRGEEYDATKEEIINWHPVIVQDYGYQNLLGSDCQPICAHEHFKAKLIKTPRNETVLDFGQNFSGYVEFTIVARKNQKMVLTHGETLDKDGNFTIHNFQNPSKPDCFQRVTYICKEGDNYFRPTKCYFGFRYVKVETEMMITGEEFTGVAIYSDMQETCQFSCGNKEVNQLFQNSLWSMKSNFIGVPTDCPTREKSGFTGDAQVFCHSALYLMDSYPVFRQWLQELSAAAFPDGGLRQIAPDHRKPGYFENSSGWCDAIEIIPWRLWKRFDTLEVAEQNYEAMKNWLMFCLERAKVTRPENLNRVSEELLPYFNDQGFHWGEWLEPGADVRETTMNNMMNGEPEVATAYLAYGCRLIAELAQALEKTEDALFFKDAANKARAAYRQGFLSDGAVNSKRQCLYVRPLALGLFEEEQRIAAARELAGLIKENGDHLNTGFLSTGEICRVLTDNGQASTAYDLLFQPECPGWLYPIKKGATTIWESWDGITSEGTIHDSLNHYSYGAITGWLIDRVCGINVEQRTIRLQPHPDERLGYARSEYDSPIGKVCCGWKYIENNIEIEIQIPCGCAAEIILPDGSKEKKGSGIWKWLLQE